ncbi:MAG TPA: hypothetical protein VI011_00610 [Asanoa sp.]
MAVQLPDEQVELRLSCGGRRSIVDRRHGRVRDRFDRFGCGLLGSFVVVFHQSS